MVRMCILDDGAMAMIPVRSSALIACLLAGLLEAHAREDSVRPADGSRPNLLLITLDSTRADHLGCYGYPLPTSPVIDGVARGGVLFTDAISQIPLTGPSHATMMTGLHPHEHGAVRNGVPLPDRARTLAERLGEAGYRTAAFLSGWTLRARLSGLDQGFDLYDDSMRDRYRLVNTQRFAHQVTPEALDWLRRREDGPFFLWVHYFDPHAPYVRRPALLEDLDAREERRARRLPSRTLKYDSEIRHMDGQIGRLLSALRDLDLERDTLVVIAADHGESLGEHGYVGHGRFLYEEIVRVPLIISWPGRIPAGIAIGTPVALLDLTPTILALMGLPAPEYASGLDLSPLLVRGESRRTAPDAPGFAERRIHFETYPGARKKFWRLFSRRVSFIPTLIGYREGSLKFVHDTRTGASFLHDLAGAGERENLIALNPDIRPSGADLVLWVESTANFTSYDMADHDDLERLRSLGYAK